MLLFINGAFGSGKTTLACDLKRRLTGKCGVFIFDPENAGYYIRKNRPEKFFISDFQDVPLWREINHNMLKSIAADFDGVVLIPMTIIDKSYFSQIAGRLSEDGYDVRSIVLKASPETIKKRLKKRLEGKNSWGALRAEECAARLDDAFFGEMIETDGKDALSVADSVAELFRFPPDERCAALRKIHSFIDRLSYIRR